MVATMADPGLQFAGRAVERIPLRRGLLQSDPPHAHQIVQDVRIHRLNWDTVPAGIPGHQLAGMPCRATMRHAAGAVWFAPRAATMHAHTRVMVASGSSATREPMQRCRATMPRYTNAVQRCCVHQLPAVHWMLHFACCMLHQCVAQCMLLLSLLQRCAGRSCGARAPSTSRCAWAETTYSPTKMSFKSSRSAH